MTPDSLDTKPASPEFSNPRKPSLRKRIFSLSSHSSKKTATTATTGMGSAAEQEKSEQPALNVATAPSTDGDVPTLQNGLASTSSAHPVQSAESLSESPESRIDRDTTTPSLAGKDNDVQEGSVNTSATLSAHPHSSPTSQKPHRTPFYRRKTASPTAAAAESTSDKLNVDSQATSNGKPKSVSTGHSKQSLLSRVVNKVVPCVGSSPRSHRVELDDMEVDATTPRASWNPAKDVPADSKNTASGTTESAVTTAHNAEASSSTDVASPPALTLLPLASTTPQHTPAPSPTDSEIIVPPPPSAHLLPEDETDGVTSRAVVPPGSTGVVDTNNVINIARVHTNDSSSDGFDGTDVDMDTDEDAEEDVHTLDEQADEERLIRKGGNGIPVGPNGEPRPLLPPILPQHVGRKCLVLDLDETLVHSSFKPTPQPADFVVPVEIEYHWHHFHVLKRPGVDEFMRRMGEIYEVVVFTASLSKYADPVLDILDIHHVVAHRLFRESCYSHKGNYVKDLSQLGRPIADTIILDNSPASYVFHPTSAVPVSSWFNDPHDAELTDLVPFLVDLAETGDVRQILDGAV